MDTPTWIRANHWNKLIDEALKLFPGSPPHLLPFGCTGNHLPDQISNGGLQNVHKVPTCDEVIRRDSWSTEFGPKQFNISQLKMTYKIKRNGWGV